MYRFLIIAILYLNQSPFQTQAQAPNNDYQGPPKTPNLTLQTVCTAGQSIDDCNRVLGHAFSPYHQVCSPDNDAYFHGAYDFSLTAAGKFFAENLSPAEIEKAWEKYINMEIDNDRYTLKTDIGNAKNKIPRSCDPNLFLHCSSNYDTEDRNYRVESKCDCNPLYSVKIETIDEETGVANDTKTFCKGRAGVPCRYKSDAKHLHSGGNLQCMEGTTCEEMTAEEKKSLPLTFHGFGFPFVMVEYMHLKAERWCKCRTPNITNTMHDCVLDPEKTKVKKKSFFSWF